MTNNKSRLKTKMKTVAELVEELREKQRMIAQEYVPQIERAVRAEYARLSKQDQRNKVYDIAGEFWSESTIAKLISSDLKDADAVRRGAMGPQVQALKRKVAKDTASMTEALESQEDEEEQPKSPISLEQERKHDDSVDDQYHYLRSLIELLSGVDYVKERDSNLALVDKTKDHRFKLVKQLSDLDVKAIYTDGRTLAHILNDYLKLLDDELDVRQAKEKLVSE